MISSNIEYYKKATELGYPDPLYTIGLQKYNICDNSEELNVIQVGTRAFINGYKEQVGSEYEQIKNRFNSIIINYKAILCLVR